MKRVLITILFAVTATAQNHIDTNKWRVIDHQTVEYWHSLNLLSWNSCSLSTNAIVTNELQLNAIQGSTVCQGTDYGPITYGWSEGNIENKTLSLTTFSATAVMQFPKNAHSALWFLRSDLCQYPTDSFNYVNPCNFTYAPYPANPYLDAPNYYEIDAVEWVPGNSTAQFGFSVHYANGLYTTDFISASTVASQYHSYTFKRNGSTLSISVDGGTATTIADPSPTVPIYPLFGVWVNSLGTPTTSETYHVASFYVCSDPTITCTASSPTLIFDGGFTHPSTAVLSGKAKTQGKAVLQ